MIEHIGLDAIVSTGDIAFTFKVAENPRDFEETRLKKNTLDWDSNANFMGDYYILPYGSNNDLPDIIKNTVKNNYIAPGLLNRKTELLWGLGPRLYREKLEGNKIIREWIDYPEIQKWLESFDYEALLLSSCEDYQHIQGTFTKFSLNKGSRISSPKITKLHHIQPNKARKAIKKLAKDSKPTHCIVTDWSLKGLSSLTEAKVYPLFDVLEPFKYPNSIMYSNKYSFCTDYYTIPDIYGSLEWLNRSTAVPLIFKALSMNGINAKYHITSPTAFWEKKREEIRSACALKKQAYKEEMLENYKVDFLNKLTESLASDENTGKFFHTEELIRVEGGTNVVKHGFTIKPIDQNVKDFVEAQIKISQRADTAVASGISISSSLGNMSEGSKVNSGSEQYYSLIGYLNTGVDIPEMIICKPINMAIKVNWPNENIKLGFFHNIPERQEDISPSKRLSNQTEQ